MTKQECKKLANSIIDYVVSLSGDIRRNSIDLSVTDTDDDMCDPEAEAFLNSSHEVYQISLYMPKNTSVDYVVKGICHELAHIICHEFDQYKKLVVDPDGEDGNTLADGFYTIQDERMAYRIGAILIELWKLHTRKGK